MTNDGALELWHQGEFVFGYLAGDRNNYKNKLSVQGNQTIAKHEYTRAFWHLNVGLNKIIALKSQTENFLLDFSQICFSGSWIFIKSYKYIGDNIGIMYIITESII